MKPELTANCCLTCHHALDFVELLGKLTAGTGRSILLHGEEALFRAGYHALVGLHAVHVHHQGCGSCPGVRVHQGEGRLLHHCVSLPDDAADSRVALCQAGELDLAAGGAWHCVADYGHQGQV